MADEQLVHDALVEIGKFAEQPITALFIAILLAGLAPSGRFSVTAARSIFLVAWIVGISSFHTFSAAQFVVASIALSLLVIGLAVWARPEVVPQYFGELIPQRTRFFSSAQLLRQMEFGSSGAILSASGPQGAPLINFFNRDALIVELIRNRVKVSTRIRDRKGEVVAEIIRNAWKVSPPPKTWDRNYNKHALEVVDAHGNVVLQIVVLADRIQVQGEWWGNERNGVRFVVSNDPLHPGGAIVFLGHTPGQRTRPEFCRCSNTLAISTSGSWTIERSTRLYCASENIDDLEPDRQLDIGVLENRADKNREAVTIWRAVFALPVILARQLVTFLMAPARAGDALWPAASQN